MPGLFGFGRKDDDESAKHDDRSPQPRTRPNRREGLPLQAHVQPMVPGGWVVRLPVRAEHVDVEKRSVVVEEVAVSTRPRRDVERVEATVRREELAVDGDLTDRVRVGDDWERR